MLHSKEMRKINYRFAAKEIEIVENHIEDEAAKGRFSTKFTLDIPENTEDEEPETLLRRYEQCIVSALVTAEYKVTSALVSDKHAINLYIDWKNF